jgi:hypothetical protein
VCQQHRFHEIFDKISSQQIFLHAAGKFFAILYIESPNVLLKSNCHVWRLMVELQHTIKNLTGNF